jgi:hypothetical protein
MRAEDIIAGLPPLELQEELAKFAGISDAKHVMLLLYILMQNDMSLIQDTLQRRGISNELPEFDQITGKSRPPHHLRSAIDNKEPGIAKPEEPDQSVIPRRQPTQSETANSRLRFRRRARPHFNEQASQSIAAFIDRFERVNILKKKEIAPWNASDAAGLLAKICEIENRDAAPFLPQIETVSNDIGDAVGSSLFRPKSNINFEDMASWQRRMSTKGRSERASWIGRRASVFVSEEIQFLAELSVGLPIPLLLFKVDGSIGFALIGKTNGQRIFATDPLDEHFKKSGRPFAF